MSLFKANEWWQAQCGEDEGFDLHSLATGNIDNSSDGESKIVVGSMSGLLRVFCAPQKGFKLEDMMLEVRLFALQPSCLRHPTPGAHSRAPSSQANIGGPILQLEIGQFTPDRRLTLAILQPRRLSLCGITAQARNAATSTLSNPLLLLAHASMPLACLPFHAPHSKDHVPSVSCYPLQKTAAAPSYPPLPPTHTAFAATLQGETPETTTHFELHRLFDLDMDRSMSSFVHGAFGGSSCDQIAALSMDGQITVVDQGAIVFKRQFPNYLLPGPLVYVPTIDSFVTATSAFEVECYRFSALAAPEGRPDSLAAFWRVIIGEPALEVSVARLTPSLAQGQVDIVILGERTLFAMSETGQLRLQMRLEYPPQALTAFPLRDGRSGIIIASATASLMVYHERRLMWSARTATAPVSIRVDKFNRTPGMLVLLDGAGKITVSYLVRSRAPHRGSLRARGCTAPLLSLSFRW